MSARTLTPEGRADIEALALTHLERGWHRAAQLAVYRDGVLRLDLRLGEGAAGRRMGGRDRMLYFSATKPLAAVAILMLADRGALDLDAPVATVWAEFAQGGKERCTVRHVLTHRGGFPVFPPEFDWAHIDDWEAVTEATAALPVRWAPGAEVGYHPVTYGFALGEVIRRIDGRMPRDFLRDEVFAPLGMDASLGVPDAQVGDVVLPRAMSEVTFQDPEGVEGRTSDIVRRFTQPSTLRAQLPAANGIGTAEALARFYAMLVGGGELGGVRLLRPESVAEATRVHAAADEDRTSGLPSSYGLGFLVGGWAPPFDQPGVFGHSGQQCAVAYGDPARGLGVAYLTDGLHDPYVVQTRTEEMAAAVVAACA
ncbi:MAG: serine hydrolase [Dehalococcoidia bacterium]|nr:serine hydrolase [Dehalococcoidia bacterium]